MYGIEDEIERATAILIAAEPWSPQYDKTPKIHTKLIQSEARLERSLRGFFKNLSELAPKIIKKEEYKQQLNAATVDVIINDEVIEDSAGTFIKIAYEQVLISTALGAQSGEVLYAKALGLTSASATIQEIALNRVAQLVGKQVTFEGKIINNPNAEFSILETTRQDIRQSISTSIALGENVTESTERLKSVINNPKRAEMIARTETVNSFGAGLHEFGAQSGAVGKHWQDVNADDICAMNADMGPIPLEQRYASGDLHPAAHPNCRCAERLIYQNELDKNPDLFG